MKKSLISTIETTVVGVLMAVLIMVFVGQSLEISGDSMVPALKDGERIIVEKVTYKSRSPERGEIVVFRSLNNDNKFLIKRVIAVPGETISLVDGKISVNGNLIEEKYVPGDLTYPDLGVLEKYSTIPLPNDNYVVMGDNRKESYDSRRLGPITLDRFVGKAFVVYWPPKEIKKI